mmetsp:Transcript_12799/g.16020  ORF Transcript_12799/g.16020 Transcript_12799/m.16020 type:complete len:169 (-) Transcript_12799:1240-1746(-)
MMDDNLYEDQIRTINDLYENDFRSTELPLARIKKIMKIEDEVEARLGHRNCMVSSDTPLVFAKACEIFIMEITERAWNVTIENKRRTLQKCDIIEAAGSNDIYDFLIDIIPRHEPNPPVNQSNDTASSPEAKLAWQQRIYQHLCKQHALHTDNLMPKKRSRLDDTSDS